MLTARRRGDGPTAGRSRRRGGAATWLLAAGAGCLLLLVVSIGAVIGVYLFLQHREMPGPDEQNNAAAGKGRAQDPSGGNPRFRDMAERLVGRWGGDLPQAGTITYDYRADGTFTLAVQRPGGPLEAEGSWKVVGIGADSLGIQRDTPAAPSEYLRPGDRPGILFPGPNLMQHTLDQTSIQFARVGSGVKPGQLPPPNERQQAVIALRLLGAEVVQDIGFAGRVRFVYFRNKNATDRHLALLKPLTELSLVEVGDSVEVTDAGLASLAGLTQLDALKIDGTSVTDAGLVHLKGMNRLVGLECGTSTIRGPGLVHLQSLPKLQSLTLNKGGVTDAGLAAISKLGNLAYVNLNDTAITDAGLTHLHGLSKLAVVHVSRTGVTDAGVRALQNARPGIRVER
jgi:hypothetical protein